MTGAGHTRALDAIGKISIFMQLHFEVVEARERRQRNDFPQSWVLIQISILRAVEYSLWLSYTETTQHLTSAVRSSIRHSSSGDFMSYSCHFIILNIHTKMSTEAVIQRSISVKQQWDLSLEDIRWTLMLFRSSSVMERWNLYLFIFSYYLRWVPFNSTQKIHLIPCVW